MEVAVIVALITAIAAVISPVITAAINSRSAEQIKRMELFEANTYSVIAEFVKSYSELTDTDFTQPRLDFLCAAYKVMALIPDVSIQSDLSSLVTIIGANKRSNAESDKLFGSLMLKISSHLSPKKRKLKLKR